MSHITPESFYDFCKNQYENGWLLVNPEGVFTLEFFEELVKFIRDTDHNLNKEKD
ncbi:MAG TPA: hypothetical protein VMV56_05810 [Williamwhitmania sp.]|nr:hypothetical protein [Williamwhitmania sp.]